MHSGTPEELQAAQKEIHDLTQEIADLFNRVEQRSEELGLHAALGMNAGELMTAGGRVRRMGGTWRVVNR